ncbi:MAG: hypothetical protein WA461_15415, partial [Nitrososphaeraceae archaeon]
SGSDKYIDSTLICICINVNLLTNTALLRLMIASGTRANVYIETQFLYLHKFFYGGVTTFTAHLLHTMELTRKGRKRFICLLSLETAVADAVAPYY